MPSCRQWEWQTPRSPSPWSGEGIEKAAAVSFLGAEERGRRRTGISSLACRNRIAWCLIWRGKLKTKAEWHRQPQREAVCLFNQEKGAAAFIYFVKVTDRETAREKVITKSTKFNRRRWNRALLGCMQWHRWRKRQACRRQGEGPPNLQWCITWQWVGVGL